MRSVTSYFNAALFRKNFSRFWPIWGLYTLCWLLALPVYSVLAGARYWDAESARNVPLVALSTLGLSAAVFFSVLAAMAVFSYLYNSRSVALLHALPVRREGLFLTNYLSGLCFFLLPNLGVFVLALLAEVVAGAVNVGSLVLWLLGQSLLFLFFYSFAVFCAMFTGHILALPVFYGILNGLAYGLVFLFDSLASSFVYGYVGVASLERAATWLTPALKLGQSLDVDYHNGYRLLGMHIVLLYAVVGVVLAAAALLVYRRRQLESAGDVVSVRWVRPVFKYGVAACCAVALGTLLFSLFAITRGGNAWGLLLCMLLCGATGYFVAEMLLRKSFRVFRGAWRGCAAVLACLAAAVCVMEFDLTGFERRVPAPGQVASVQLSRVGSAPYDELNHTYWNLEDPEDLALAEQLHQAVVAWKDHTPDTDDWHYLSIDFTYILKDGGLLLRQYGLPLTRADLDDPASPAALLTRLINDPELVKARYFSNWHEDHRLLDAEVTTLSDRGGDYDSVHLDPSGLDALLTAVRDDLSAGRLGRRYLLDTGERMENCYLSDLILTFQIPENTQKSGSYHYEAGSRTYTITIGLEASATETLAVLEQYSLVGDTHLLVTHAQDSLGQPFYPNTVHAAPADELRPLPEDAAAGADALPS